MLDVQSCVKKMVWQRDTEKTASIKLIKTDSQSGEYLKGARFNLERLNTDGEWETVSDNTNIATNVMGELSISGIKFGTYRLKEINAPIGYELNENPYTESVVLDSTTVGKTFELKMQNDRKTGSASMTKYSEDGKTPLAGAKYDLYMVIGEIDSEENGEKDDQPIKYSLTTDTNGTTPTVSGLEWGKYYFVEVYAPKGYKKSSQKISFEITAQDVDVRKDMDVPSAKRFITSLLESRVEEGRSVSYITSAKKKDEDKLMFTVTRGFDLLLSRYQKLCAQRITGKKGDRLLFYVTPFSDLNMLLNLLSMLNVVDFTVEGGVPSVGVRVRDAEILKKEAASGDYQNHVLENNEKIFQEQIELFRLFFGNTKLSDEQLGRRLWR